MEGLPLFTSAIFLRWWRTELPTATLKGCVAVTWVASLVADVVARSAVQEADYCFAVVEEASGRFAELEVRPYDDRTKQQFQSVWQRLCVALQGHHKICTRAAPAWTTWKPWDWCEERKPGYEGRIKYAAWCGDMLAGFLNVWADFPSAHQAGKVVLYLEHIAAAPGNQTTELWNRRYKAVGAALFAYAVLMSHQKGFDGRLGLHVAEAEALGFYHHISKKCGEPLFYPDKTDVAGPTPRGASEKGKTYLETTEAGALRWLQEYRRE